MGETGVYVDKVVRTHPGTLTSVQPLHQLTINAGSRGSTMVEIPITEQASMGCTLTVPIGVLVTRCVTLRYETTCTTFIPYIASNPPADSKDLCIDDLLDRTNNWPRPFNSCIEACTVSINGGLPWTSGSETYIGEQLLTRSSERATTEAELAGNCWIVPEGLTTVPVNEDGYTQEIRPTIDRMNSHQLFKRDRTLVSVTRKASGTPRGTYYTAVRRYDDCLIAAPFLTRTEALKEQGLVGVTNITIKIMLNSLGMQAGRGRCPLMSNPMMTAQCAAHGQNSFYRDESDNNAGFKFGKTLQVVVEYLRPLPLLSDSLTGRGGPYPVRLYKSFEVQSWRDKSNLPANHQDSYRGSVFLKMNVVPERLFVYFKDAIYRPYPGTNIAGSPYGVGWVSIDMSGGADAQLGDEEPRQLANISREAAYYACTSVTSSQACRMALARVPGMPGPHEESKVDINEICRLPVFVCRPTQLNTPLLAENVASVFRATVTANTSTLANQIKNDATPPTLVVVAQTMGLMSNASNMFAAWEGTFSDRYVSATLNKVAEKSVDIQFKTGNASVDTYND